VAFHFSVKKISGICVWC